ncbi:PREDICTED: uncharacterized protein LOC101312354 [Fragaria vesca subsp. vesca]|uniref:uncharacterized protein LOC101312354 n=1 Tax=Fragaria vesca subsp. vesca TaxID=101020 RepID=UPI0002C34A48|nr:PREDICTED: uncharacterized protein LOC101312354 [Fragaria vesca subsp. vesca]
MPITYEMENTDNNSLAITLRPYRLSDAEDFLMYAGDERVTQFTRWNTLNSKEQALSYIKEFCIPHCYCKSICFNDRSIGFLFIKPYDEDNEKCRAEVGYVVAAEYWGRGIATRALKMAIIDVFKQFTDLVRLQAKVLIENKGSQRVLEKLGFQKEGLLRKYTIHRGTASDLFMYSLLSTDPMP